MTYPSDPTGFLSDRAPATPWRWRLLDAEGGEVTLYGSTSGQGPSFSSQADAETWMGESWQDLVEQDVDSVVLIEGDREVYGPMSLHA